MWLITRGWKWLGMRSLPRLVMGNSENPLQPSVDRSQTSGGSKRHHSQTHRICPMWHKQGFIEMNWPHREITFYQQLESCLKQQLDKNAISWKVVFDKRRHRRQGREQATRTKPHSCTQSWRTNGGNSLEFGVWINLHIGIVKIPRIEVHPRRRRVSGEPPSSTGRLKLCIHIPLCVAFPRRQAVVVKDFPGFCILGNTKSRSVFAPHGKIISRA